MEEDNHPDNYYSNIDAKSPDYYDVMLVTEIGLVNVVMEKGLLEKGGSCICHDGQTGFLAYEML